MERDEDAPQAVKDAFAAQPVGDRWGCDAVSGPIGVTGDPLMRWRVTKLVAEVGPGDLHCFVTRQPGGSGGPVVTVTEAVLRR